MVRTGLVGKAGLFAWPGMLTLTIDGAGTLPECRGFDGPQAGWEFVTKGQYIARLMRALGVKRWVWAMEFHKSGWPHWHVVFDRGEVHGQVDYGLMHRLWRDTWGIGLAKASDVRLNNGEGAMLYITKYLTKKPDHPPPSWVLELPATRRIRCVQASKEVGAIWPRQVASVVPEDQADDEGDDEDVQSSAGRLADAIARCGLRSQLVQVTEHPDGTVSRRFLGELPAGPGVLAGGDLDHQDVQRALRLALVGDPDDGSVDFNVVEEQIPYSWGISHQVRVRSDSLAWVDHVERVRGVLLDRYEVGELEVECDLDAVCLYGCDPRARRWFGDDLLEQSLSYEAGLRASAQDDQEGIEQPPSGRWASASAGDGSQMSDVAAVCDGSAVAAGLVSRAASDI